jgi:hypothetical protein
MSVEVGDESARDETKKQNTDNKAANWAACNRLF